MIMSPTLEKLEGHNVLGLSVGGYACVWVGLSVTFFQNFGAEE